MHTWDNGSDFRGRRITRTQTHTQTPALILYPKKWERLMVKEPDLIFLPVSVLGHP